MKLHHYLLFLAGTIFCCNLMWGAESAGVTPAYMAPKCLHAIFNTPTGNDGSKPYQKRTLTIANACPNDVTHGVTVRFSVPGLISLNQISPELTAFNVSGQQGQMNYTGIIATQTSAGPFYFGAKMNSVEFNNANADSSSLVVLLTQ
jgi:hypothetical protein